MMRNTILMLGVLAAVALSCDSGPKAGELPFDFETPNNDDRAIAFRATATAPFAITGIASNCSGCQVFVERVSDIDWRGILTGVPGNGPAILLEVSDRKEVEAYSMTVTRVAGADYGVRSTRDRRLVLRK